MLPNCSKDPQLLQIQAFLEMWVCLVHGPSLVGFTRMVLFKEGDDMADSEEDKAHRSLGY